ncbi:MAG: DEAD/DEAH box helicase [Verrucomicrobiota bacterium]|nr:DEAD/DEAH box helicase [Verrucomicrobiota bacterium]
MAKEWNRTSYQVPVEEGKTRFVDLDLPEALLHALSDLNFLYCTPIQARSLPISLDGLDVCGRAQTGTGKTAAFLLTVFKQLMERPAPKEWRKGHPRALIMAPTRELCMQIARDGEALGAYTGLRILAVYGGMDMQAQRTILREKHVDVVVATPGRLLDFRQRQDVDFSQVEILVIDEADRMLDMGFIPDMRRIVYGCPPKTKRQTLLFSATLTKDVMHLASQWMNDPTTVDIEPEHIAAETIDQRVYIVTENQKFTIVYNILQNMKPERVIIFGNRRDSTELLCDNLRHQGVHTALLSGAVDQRKRVKVLDEFRSGRVPVLVATDVAGRGLHIDGVDLIINFNVPEQAEDYVHRIGRTGRVGEKGTSITFADEVDSYYIPAVEEYMKQPLKCVQPPEEWLAELPNPMLEKKRRPRASSPGGRNGRSGGSRSRPSGPSRRKPRR